MQIYYFTKEEVGQIIAEHVSSRLDTDNPGVLQVKPAKDGGYEVFFIEQNSSNNKSN